MTNEFTLDDLNQVLEKKYGPFVFKAGREKFVLQQPLRLSKEKREIVKAQLLVLEHQQDELTEDEVFAVLKAIVENVIEGDKADRLFEVLENDLVKITILFEQWVGRAQVGEA